MSLRDQHPLLYRPGLRADFRDSYKNWQPIYSSYLKVGSMAMPEVSASILTGPKRLFEVRDGEQVTYQEIISGPKVMAVDKEYKSGYYVTKKAIEDDQYGKLNQGAKWLAKAANLTKEYTAVALVDNAWATTLFAGIDGLALMSTAHTLLNSSSTVANTPSTAVSLTVSGFTQLMDLGRKMKDENGDPIIMNYDKLMIANDQGQINKAYQILESQLQPFTANNQDNPIRRNFKPKEVIINPYMSNLFNWFMIDSSMNDANFLVRSEVAMKDWVDEETDVTKVKARGRWCVWFVDWRPWVGSQATS
jgi:Mu-like prophage major head subunit gpT